jgi:hypothetical protein
VRHLTVSRTRRLLCVLVAGLGLSLTACPPANPQANVPTRPISKWAGTEATLFDDGIDIGAVPAAKEVEPPRDDHNDQLIGARLRDADGVVIAKVKGVSREPVGDGQRFVVDLLVEGEPLMGKAPSGALVLRVGPDSPAFGTVRGREQEIVGRRLVVYYRLYAPPPDSDEATLHFHLSGASAGLLEDIKKQIELLK